MEPLPHQGLRQPIPVNGEGSVQLVHAKKAPMISTKTA